MTQPTAPLPELIRAQAPGTARALSVIIERLIAFLAAYLRPHPHRVQISFALHNRLNRINRRFARLMAIIASGRAPRVRPARAQAPRPRTPRAERLPQITDTYIPRTRGWLLRGHAHHSSRITLVPETLRTPAKTITVRSNTARQRFQPVIPTPRPSQPDALSSRPFPPALPSPRVPAPSVCPHQPQTHPLSKNTH